MITFVLDKHNAIKRGPHFDLRFKIPNSENWASFSMNKFPPTKPGVKVYIPRSPDHSEEKALFTGKIEKGEYGAGTITREDQGECIVHKYSRTHIVVEFRGKKLKGLYHFINTSIFNKKKANFYRNIYSFFKGKINEK
jgi:bifunctional non-homologous end joining protein LigD